MNNINNKKVFLNEIHFLKAYKIINYLPEISKDEFLEKTEPGDVILVQPKNYATIFKMTRKYLMQLAQRSLATSSKIYGGDEKIIGYDVKRNVQPISITTFNDFCSRYHRLILVKPKHFTVEQRTEFLSFVKKRIGLDYNTSELQKSLWNRILYFIKTNKIENYNKEEYKEALSNLKRTFFCSNLISVGLFKAGWRGNFNNTNILDVWPVDFLLSKDFEKVGQYHPD